MLKKCLKHDLRYVYDVWKIATLIFVPLSIIGGLSMRVTFFMDNPYPVIIKVLSVIGMMLFYIGTVAYLFVGAGMGMYRYYQTCFTDEGYLTFTLPVKRHTILNSKILSTVIPFAASAVVMLICFHATFALVPSQNPDTPHLSALAVAYRSISEFLKVSFKMHGFMTVVYAAQILVLATVGTLAVLLAIFSAITRSPEAKKRPKMSVAKGLLAYFLIGPIFMGVALLALLVASCADAIAATSPLTVAESGAVMFLIFTMLTMALTVLCALLYRDNLVRIREKLNLS